LHGGLGLDHTYLVDAFVGGLGDRAHLVFIDHVGNGASSMPPGGPSAVTFESMADAIDDVRVRLGVTRWHVVGHSYGGCIALHLALRHPDTLASLAVIGAAMSFAHSAAIVVNAQSRATPELAVAFLSALGAPASDDTTFGVVWREVLPLHYHRWDPAYLEAFAASRYSAAAYNRGNELLPSYDLTARVGGIRAATLVISGDDDFIMPAALAGAPLAAAIPGAAHVVVPGSGHMPFHENAPAMFAALNRHVDR
jgi:pimeloyl-ACP methyl ester carboxylesterase